MRYSTPGLTFPALCGRNMRFALPSSGSSQAGMFNRVDLNVLFRHGLRLGQLIEADNPTRPTPYYATVTGISIAIGAAAIDCQLTLEQPR